MQADNKSNERGLIVVAGATGYLGKHVISALHARGWKIRALARNPEKLAEVRSLCHEVFVGEATKPETLEGLFAASATAGPVRAACSSLGIRHFRRKPSFWDVDYAANLHLVEAAAEAGVRHFGFVSVLNGGQVRENSPLVEARERVVDRLRTLHAAGTMAASVFRPTGFFNDMKEIFQMAQSGKAWLIGDGTTRINPIHGGDLAEAIASSFESAPPFSGSVRELSLGGPDIFTQEELAALAFKTAGKEPRYGRVPGWLITRLGRMISPFHANAGALTQMFAQLGYVDALGRQVGHHHLEQAMQEWAQH